MVSTKIQQISVLLLTVLAMFECNSAIWSVGFKKIVGGDKRLLNSLSWIHSMLPLGFLFLFKFMIPNL